MRKRTKAIEDEEEENYYKQVRVSHFSSNYYIEDENNGDTNKTLSVEEYFNKISPYLISQKI